MAKKDFYELLGVDRNASEADIKKAYRRLAREHHPDVAKDKGSEEKFKEISEAYSVLSDQEKRSQYDRFGHSAFEGAAGSGGAGYQDFSSAFGDIFESFFGGSPRRGQAGPVKGDDLRYDMEIPLEESAFGAEKTIDIQHLANCSTCGGTGAKPGTKASQCGMCHGSGYIQQYQRTMFGQFAHTTACPRCHGEGTTVESPCSECRGQKKVRERKKIKVKIPAGVDSGSRLRVTAEGNAGDRGGPPGDLYVFLNIKKHPNFVREGNELYAEVEISFAQAALGTEINVPTLEGTEKLKVPAGTQTGTSFRITGKGIPYLGRQNRGDLHVEAQVTTPKNLSDEEKQLYARLAEIRRENVILPGKKILDRVFGK